MASFASSVAMGGARKHVWTKTMASFASSAATGGARKHAWTKSHFNVKRNSLTENKIMNISFVFNTKTPL